MANQFVQENTEGKWLYQIWEKSDKYCDLYSAART